MGETKRSDVTVTPPSRKFSWRRVLLPNAILLLVILTAHGGWRWQAGRALERQIDQLRAAGEPVLPDDFRPKEWLASTDNAAGDLTAAAAIVDDDSPEADAVAHVPTTLPVDPRAWPYLTRAADYFQPALRRVERARAKKTCRWDHDLRSPVADHMQLRELNGLYDLDYLLRTAALVEHHAGNDAASVRRIEQMLYLSRLAEPTPDAAGHNAAASIALGTAWFIEQLAPEFNISADANGSSGADRGGGGNDGGAAARGGSASPADVRRLIAALLDESDAQAGLLLAMRAERMGALDRLQSILRGQGTLSSADGLGVVARYAASPFLDRSARIDLVHLSAFVEVARETADYATAAARLDAAPRPGKYDAFTWDHRQSARHALQHHYQSLTDRRLAAATLAIRLYQLDHAGRRPARLEELVPAYLPAVPRDPMAADRPIGYLPRPDDPVLYSVGLNGADDAASEAAIPEEYGEVGEWRRLDRVFYLARHVRPVLYVPRPGDGSNVAFVGVDSDVPPWERDAAPPP